jgi:hypothetical protein
MSTHQSEKQPVHVADDPRFREHLMCPTPLEVLLRGHLWAESELIGILEDTLPYPERIDFSRLSFPLKVALVAANGYLNPDDVPAFLKLNSLRNKIAHNLHTELGEESVNELLDTFGNVLKHSYGDDSGQSFAEFAGDPLWIGRLRAAIACLCIMLSGQREGIAEQHRKERETHARFIALVNWAKTGKQSDDHQD